VEAAAVQVDPAEAGEDRVALAEAAVVDSIAATTIAAPLARVHAAAAAAARAVAKAAVTIVAVPHAAKRLRNILRAEMPSIIATETKIEDVKSTARTTGVTGGTRARQAHRT
jgi:iron-sulfur cluster repair protein YtfE (RIC family)